MYLYTRKKERKLEQKAAEAKAVVFLIKTCCISRSSRRFLVFLRRMLPCLRLIRFSLLFRVSFRSFGSFYHKDAFPFLSSNSYFTSLSSALIFSLLVTILLQIKKQHFPNIVLSFSYYLDYLTINRFDSKNQNKTKTKLQHSSFQQQQQQKRSNMMLTGNS